MSNKIYNEKYNEKIDIKLIKKAILNFSKEISSNAINEDKLKSISPLDACTCTGNCGGGGGEIISIK